MKRRKFITLVGFVAAAAWSLAARAQQAVGRMRRVGIMMPFPKGEPEYERRVLAFREELVRLGWIDGRNVQFDERWTTDNMDRLGVEAESLLASNPDVVIGIGGRVIPVLLRMSRTVPIVVPGVSDPVGVGWVSNLARPGGNITGFTFFELSILGRMLDILKQLAPATRRVAFIYNPDNPSAAFFRRTFEAAAGQLNIEPKAIQIHGIADIERAVADLGKQANAGIFFPPDITITALRNQVIALVARHRLPAIYPDSFFVKDGGLVYYGSDRVELVPPKRQLRGPHPARRESG